jgi:hypothetical protein
MYLQPQVAQSLLATIQIVDSRFAGRLIPRYTTSSQMSDPAARSRNMHPPFSTPSVYSGARYALGTQLLSLFSFGIGVAYSLGATLVENVLELAVFELAELVLVLVPTALV